MSEFAATHGWPAIVASLAVMALAGFVKGAVGFALPMVAVSGIGTILSPQVAVAGLILPSLVTNVWQALRQGPAAAAASLRAFLPLVLVMVAVIFVTAQVFAGLPERATFLVLGLAVTLAAFVQLLGWRPPDPGRGLAAQGAVGLAAGLLGGLAAIWGPPIVLYLLARGTGKVEMVRVQGLSYLLGSVALTVAHLRSGLLDAQTGAFSALLILPALLGMAAGVAVQDRLPQGLFRRATMAVLVLVGLNMLRRAAGL